MGWNPWGELSFTGITETKAELVVHEGYLVTTPYLTNRMDRERSVGDDRGGQGINANPPHQDGQRQRGGGVGGREGGQLSKPPPPPPHPTRTDRDSGASVSGVGGHV